MLIEQLEARARLKNEEQERQWNKEHKEQGMRQEKEISQLKEITRLQNDEQERQWNRKQKEYEF